jgi:hypothetical protein
MVTHAAREETAGLELAALERMIRARCRQLQRWTQEAIARGELHSREADLQLQAFAERHAAAIAQLEVSPSEPDELRITRLERLLAALDCSWSYFRAQPVHADESQERREWAIRI